MKNKKKGNWKKSVKGLFGAAQLSAVKRRGIGWFFAGVFFLGGIWLWEDFTVVLAIDEVPTSVQEGISVQETEVSDTEQFIRWRSTRSETWYHYDYPQSVIEAQDGSYVAAGYSSPVENSQYRRNAYVTKFNKNGTIVWDRVFGGGIEGQGLATPAANYEFLKVVELANGDYLAMGATNDALGLVEAGYASIFAVKIDSDGNTQWQKAYGLQDKKISLNAWDAEENDDGTISIWGNHTVGGGYPVMIELILNENGNLLDYFLITDDLALENSVRATDCAMIKTDDGGLIAYQHTFGGSFWSDCLVKLSPDGVWEWGFRLLPDAASTGHTGSYIKESKIIPLSDGYLIPGITQAKDNAGALKAVLIVYKVDLNGNLQWTKLYQNLTLNNYASNLSAYKTDTDDILLSVQNGSSTIDFTVIKLDSANGLIDWVKAYGNKTGFERGYGGNASFKILEDGNDQLIGVGRSYLTKFSGDGSIAFITDEFMTQERTAYTITDVETTLLIDGALEKRSYPEVTAVEKDISVLTGYSVADVRVIGEGATLESIVITTAAAKLSYQIGEALDLTGLVVTGTYSNGTTKVETITADQITGFNSAAATANQTLTITVNGKTATYLVQIVASEEPGQGELTGFLGQDPTGSYYLYHKADFSNSYLAYQINPGLSAAKMYQHFVNNKCKIVALKDLTKGYMDYNAAATASLMAQIRGEAFDINAYFGRSDAKLYYETVVNVKIVDKDGNIS